MAYNKIALFGKKESKGTFDDFFSTEKYSSLQDAYKAEDYVQANFVQDDDGTLFIEAYNVKNYEIKKYHKLNYQRCFAGIDILDDRLAVEMSVSLI